MSYNAGDKVRVALKDGQTVRAVIVGRRFGGLNKADTLFYRDDCKSCQGSTLHKHTLGSSGTYLV